MASAASPVSAESDPPPWKHDVFLSFRGEDTRRAFVSHLDRALAWQAMKTFKDDRDLDVGATIRPELLTAIEESYLAIIVLSPNYASSTWCLDELSKILECMEDTKRILPIFYHVDPSDVRNQRGSFAEAFTKHEEGFSGDTEELIRWRAALNRWRAALRKVADLSGLHSTTYKSEAELIEDIVKRVWKKVNPTFTSSDSEEKLVGIDFALDQLRLHLSPEENDVRFIGIWGMGGVGKTTLAKLVYQKIYHHFEHFCFLSDVRKKEISELQRLLLSSIMKVNEIQVTDEIERTFVMKNRLRNKRVLLVLDDVDHRNQLEKLVGNKNWFGKGSRIIITTRNERLLVDHDIAIRYKVEVLKNDEALGLFRRHAFKKDQPEKGFQELCQEFLGYAKGLPLALKTLGRALYGRDQDAWESVLRNLRKIPYPDIFDSLKVSYYGLTEMGKKIFLHVACLHRGSDKEQVIQMLDWIFVISSHIEIDILIEKSLLTINKHFGSNIVEMHDLIQEMAWIIVREESHEKPGQRRLLWCRDDIFHVLKTNTGTGAIEGIVLRLPELEEVRWNCTDAFKEMHGLKLIDFDNVVFSSGPTFLPDSLRIIHWRRYPSKSLPSSFEPPLLAKLEMSHSKLVRLWDGTPDFPELKYVNLSYSENLTSIPDFTGSPNLEELNLDGCKKLGEVHSSIAVQKKLKVLTLRGCKSIKSLPSKWEMDSLKFLSLQGCSNLKKVLGFWDSLFGIRKSHPYPWGLVLSSLNYSCSLTSLDLGDCNIGEGDIPDDIGHCLSSLGRLNLSGNNFVSLPASIKCLSYLWDLDLRRCERLEQLPDLPPKRPLSRVLVDDCVVLKGLSDPSKFNPYYGFTFSCLNCFRLVEDEYWINRIFAMIMKSARITRPAPLPFIVWPRSEIPDWFDNRSAGNSITVVEPPPSPHDWVGIAICVVFEDSYFETPAAFVGYDTFEIKCMWHTTTFKFGQLKSKHLWVSYLTRHHMRTFNCTSKFEKDGSCSHIFKFGAFRLGLYKIESSIEKCGIRFVYEKDLEEYRRILKIPNPKPALPTSYSNAEAGPIGSSGSGSSDDDDEPGSGRSDEDDEPISKRSTNV